VLLKKVTQKKFQKTAGKTFAHAALNDYI